MKLNELEIAFEQRKAGFTDIEYYIDSIAVKSFDMYYSGWELDTKAWILDDGSIFTTNHGRLCEFSRDDFEKYRKQMNEVVSELNEIK